MKVLKSDEVTLMLDSHSHQLAESIVASEPNTSLPFQRQMEMKANAK
jgi:hypothetical protein